MKVLVTGGAGYIGSHVVNLLGLAGYDPVIVDDLSTGRKKSILFGHHEKQDIGNLEFMEQLMQREKFDACLHFAGSVVVPESVQNPIKYYDNNVRKSLELIRLCQKYRVHNFIFSSTATVYGNPEGICTEETPTNPIHPYGRSKLMTEWFLEDVAQSSELNYIILRYFNVSGANVEGKIGQCSPQATHLIKVACECVAGKRSRVEIFGEDYPTRDGTCERDYIHVDDLAQAHVDALCYLEKNRHSHTLNCGYGHGYSVKDIIEAVKRITQVDFETRVTGRRPGDATRLVSSAQKIKDIIGWRPRHDNLETIISTAYQWEKKYNP